MHPSIAHDALQPFGVEKGLALRIGQATELANAQRGRRRADHGPDSIGQLDRKLHRSLLDFEPVVLNFDEVAVAKDAVKPFRDF